MEYVLGKDLEELLNDSLVQRRMPLEEIRVLSWMVDVCDALTRCTAYACRSSTATSSQRISRSLPMTPCAHRLRPGQVAAHRASDANCGPAVSPGSAPPEQYMAKGRADARTDIYGLGATLWPASPAKIRLKPRRASSRKPRGGQWWRFARATAQSQWACQRGN